MELDKQPLNKISWYDGTGRHYGLKIRCLKTVCRFESDYQHQMVISVFFGTCDRSTHYCVRSTSTAQSYYMFV